MRIPSAITHLILASAATAAAWAVAPGETATTLLFVDDHSVLYRSGTKRVMHPAVKHAQNPVIPADKPWERTIAYNTVHRDPQTGRYQVWYQAATSLSPEATAVCYAESDDGINWRKPALGLFPHDGKKDTNIVLEAMNGHYGASVLFDPRDADGSRRYKMAFWQALTSPAGKKSMGLSVAFSPDGIHWKRHPRTQLIKGPGGKSMDPPLAGDPFFEGIPISVTFSDVIDTLFDPVRNVFAIYAKTWTDGPDGKMFWKRAVVRSESRDFTTWSAPQLVVLPDEFDGTGVEYRPPVGKVHPNRRGVQLHGGPAFFHEGVYFSLLQVMDGETTGEMPSELAVSRDGLTWVRPFRSTPFIAVTHRREDFDGGCIWSNSTPVVLPDEIRFYYGGYAGLWNWNGDLFRPPTGIGMATIRRDRFAGVRPIERIGQVTTKSIELRGLSSLSINADASDGAVRVEILDETGYRVQGFTRGDALAVKGDSLRHKAGWKGKSLRDLPSGRYLIRLHLENAEVFAITLN